MTPRLLLDEMISPALVKPCWEAGMDAVALRDRGKLQASDTIVWEMAQQERRALVTINAVHFLPRASACPTHSGLVLLPDGGTRAQQLDFIMVARKRALGIDAFNPNYDGSVVTVLEDLTVTWEGGDSAYTAPGARSRGLL